MFRCAILLFYITVAVDRKFSENNHGWVTDASTADYQKTLLLHLSVSETGLTDKINSLHQRNYMQETNLISNTNLVIINVKITVYTHVNGYRRSQFAHQEQQK